MLHSPHILLHISEVLLHNYVHILHFFVIRFLFIEGNKPIEIHGNIALQYCKVFSFLQQVYDRSEKFENEVSIVTDATLQGQDHRVVTPQATAETF
jgi:hypothetical protein